MLRTRMIALLLIVLCQAPLRAGELLFHLTGDATKPALASGRPTPLTQKNVQTVEGKVGSALRFAKGSLLRFAAAGNLDRRRGTVCMWVRSNWDAEERSNHTFFADDRDFRPGNNSMLLWEWHTGMIRFDVRDEKDHYLVHNAKAWKKGEWRHVAAAWDCEVGTWLFVDGALVAIKKFTWQPKESQHFQFGVQGQRGWQADAVLDDIRIYGQPLTAAQVRRVMGGKKLDTIRYLGLLLPDRITVGEEFDAQLRLEAPEHLADDYAVALLLDDLRLASLPLRATSLRRTGKTATVSMRACIPPYLYPAPGRRTIAMKIDAAFELDGEKAQRQVVLCRAETRAPRDYAQQLQGLPPDSGILARDGRFYAGEDALQAGNRLLQGGRFLDTAICRRIDAVDCTKTDHNYWENTPATVEELKPGRKFRCVGPQESVTQKRLHRKREHPALAAFSYRLKVVPRPTPHLIVLESIDDAERYLEVAIDHPRDSTPAPHLASSGCGQRVAIHLSVTYGGREYRTDGVPYRQTFMIFPKTDEIEVMISGTKRGRFPEASPAAVSRMWAYEMIGPLADLANPIMLPEGQPQRSVSIFFPAVHNIFQKYGFANTGPEARGSTLRLFIDYLRFMGLNRFELRAFQLSSQASFKTDRFEHPETFDIFAEALPLMQEAGIDVVPRVMYLHCYHKLLEGDEENFQHSVDGTIQSFGREGPIPDPLRPQTQKVVLDSIKAFLEACEGYDNVPAVGFDTSIGGLYWNRKAPTSHTGYSRWDVEQFARNTGIALPEGLEAPKKRFEWLKANMWDQWVSWRCRRWHSLCTRIRDLAKARGKQLELSVRVMPREEFWTGGVPIKEIYQYTGYDPDLFRNESDIIMDYFVRINSDRYFGRSWWKPWFYDPRQPGLFVSKEPRHVEMYYNYWEVPFHPWGFRVGPGSPVGRAFFEPLTYCMRKLNPRDVTLFNWFRATIGRELEVREFCRAFRALPAVEPRDFDGTISAEPMDDRLWVKWFGDRLAIVNDAGWQRKVKLKIPLEGARGPIVIDATFNHPVPTEGQGDVLAFELQLREFDLRTLVFRPLAEGGHRQ